MGGYKMLNLKQDIANVIRKMMFVDDVSKWSRITPDFTLKVQASGFA